MQLCRFCTSKVAEHVVESTSPVNNNNNNNETPTKIRFDEIVYVREYPVMLGNLQLCRPSSHCPRMCRNTPIPVVLGDLHQYRSYQQPLVVTNKKQSSRSLVAKNCSQQLDRLEHSGHNRTLCRRTVQEFWVGHYRFATNLLSESSLQAKYGVTDARFLWTPLDADDQEAMLWGPAPSRLGFRLCQTLVKKVQQTNSRMTPLKVSKVYRKLQDQSSLVASAETRANLLRQQLQNEERQCGPPDTIVVPNNVMRSG